MSKSHQSVRKSADGKADWPPEAIRGSQASGCSRPASEGLLNTISQSQFIQAALILHKLKAPNTRQFDLKSDTALALLSSIPMCDDQNKMDLAVERLEEGAAQFIGRRVERKES